MHACSFVCLFVRSSVECVLHWSNMLTAMSATALAAPLLNARSTKPCHLLFSFSSVLACLEAVSELTVSLTQAIILQPAGSWTIEAAIEKLTRSM